VNGFYVPNASEVPLGISSGVLRIAMWKVA
jgi:hypothetical protein